MPDSGVRFIVTNFQAQLARRLTLQWQQRDIDPGPVKIELDSATARSNRGVLDYVNGRIDAEFAVKLTFPEFADMLNAAGVNAFGRK